MKKIVTSCVIALSIGMSIGLIVYKRFHRDSIVKNFDSKIES